ncbi:hypothetical protein A2cp1_1128 [Anaeromyxobacter dehalogenans 2CP-1]|uniref:Uncharacterized protein n=1 Tax=Anaeromyxobacter dehalogenans (strain ATCC BAA-258 / DSM 21875 / 2CP-1) TaxID=455488 RepID=B8JFN5_ANAD2|nr:hypothetical protein [Anaeromyxobacter dehalogenans]ACL64473.1 hypothetical protein A2cp1_1128 [Anaeromyxobacter dehalogenans 2CP-1]
MGIEDLAERILVALAEYEKHPGDTGRGRYGFNGAELSELINRDAKASPDEINDAIEYLDDNGLLERRDFLGTHPFSFGHVGLNSRGRHAYEKLKAPERPSVATATVERPYRPPQRPPTPFGFTEYHWAEVDALVAQGKIRVVMGYQWNSAHYDRKLLVSRIESQFRWALDLYNEKPKAGPKEMVFTELAAGYGEHLFTNIIRDILAADIAVFDTSDLNPNVMLELGAALALGVTVLPIRAAAGAKPPSDIVGLTWAEYSNSAERFADHPGHLLRLAALVARAAERHRG